MTARIKKHAKALTYLSSCNKKTANQIVEASKPEFIKCISDICHNTLKGRIDLSPQQLAKLKKYKSEIRTVAGKKATIKTKKKIIQKGGFLGAILRPLIGSVLPLLFSQKR